MTQRTMVITVPESGHVATLYWNPRLRIWQGQAFNPKQPFGPELARLPKRQRDRQRGMP